MKQFPRNTSNWEGTVINQFQWRNISIQFAEQYELTGACFWTIKMPFLARNEEVKT
jgi:hypothetical protein